MLVKIFSRGVGRGSGPVDYLLGENRDREDAKLLRGHADRTESLIDSLRFSQKYVSGVLSFEESNISEEQKKEIMDGFEQALLPDMQGRTDWLWVEHLDKDRLELNFVIPTVDLETGKRLQPYYHRADLNRVDAFKSLTNDINNFSDPNSPDKTQTITLKSDESIGRKDLKITIDKFVVSGFESGMINNRNDVINAIKDQGLELSRTTKKSVTFLDPGTQQKFRMTGAFYADSFRSRKEIQGADGAAAASYKRDRERRIEHNSKRLEEAVRRKRIDLEKRYKKTEQSDKSTNGERQEATERVFPVQPMAGGSSASSFDSSLSRLAMVRANDIESTFTETDDKSRNENRLQLQRGFDVRDRDGYQVRPRDEPSIHRNKQEIDDDRARANASERIGDLRRKIQHIRIITTDSRRNCSERSNSFNKVNKFVDERTRRNSEEGEKFERTGHQFAGRVSAFRERAERDKLITEKSGQIQPTIAGAAKGRMIRKEDRPTRGPYR